MATKAAKEAVTNYIRALNGDTSVIETGNAEELKAQAQAKRDEGDIIEALRLESQARQAEKPDLSPLEQAFVQHAKDLADEAGITADAFRHEGVPAKVLREAGFSVRGGGGSNGKRASSDDVRADIAARTEPFILSDVQESTGASLATVRKVVSTMEEEGNLTNEGSDPDHSGPGRAPTRYAPAA